MTSLPLVANTILTIVGIIIAIGNAMVCFAFYKNRKVRTITNHFVISLAISDFLVGSVLAPMNAWNSTSSALGPLIAFTLIGSLSNISGCTYDRFVAIQHPLRYQAILTKAKLHKVLVIIWVIPVVVTLVPQLWLAGGSKLGLSFSTILKINRIYVGCMAFGVLATCLVLTAIYVRVFQVARKHMAAISYLSNFNQPQKNEDNANGTRAPGRRLRRFSLRSLVKDVKATKLFAIIASTFVLCWLPLIIINITDSIGFQDKLPMAFVNTALFTIFGNSLVNPIIYALFQPSFRQTFASWFRCSRCRDKSDDLTSMTNGGDKGSDKKTKRKKNRKKQCKSTYELQSMQDENSHLEASMMMMETRLDDNQRLVANGDAIASGGVLPEVRL